MKNDFPLTAELVDTEAASVERVAQILKLMKPPLAVPKDAERGPRMFELSVAGLPGESDTRYLVQVPPEYDPLRHYPAIVTLADVTASPEQMLDFWAGPFEQGKSWRAARSGDTARIHHDCGRLAATASIVVRLLGSRAPCRAWCAARCVP